MTLLTLVMASGAYGQNSLTLNRPVLNLPATPVFPGNILETKIIKPVIKRPVGTKLAAVAAEKFGPSTKVTVGLYDEDGNVDGQKVMTGQEIHNDLNTFTLSNKTQFSRALRGLRGTTLTELRNKKIDTQVVERKVFDRELNQEIEVVEIPQELEESTGFVLQNTRLLKIPVTPILRPIIINPNPTHEAKPYEQKVRYSNTWGSSSKFSAYIDAGFEAYGARHERQAYGYFKSGGKVFNKNVSLVDFYTKVERQNTTNKGYSRIKVLGSTKWESSAQNPSKTYSITRESSKRQRFWVGPLPVSVGGAVGGKVGMGMNLYSPDFNSIQGNATPYIDSYGAADAAIDVWLARAGIEGKLRVIKDSLPSNVTLKYDNTKQNLNFKLEVKNELNALDGKVSVYAKVRKFWGGWKKWSKTIFSWNGFSKSWTLINKNLTVNI